MVGVFQLLKLIYLLLFLEVYNGGCVSVIEVNLFAPVP